MRARWWIAALALTGCAKVDAFVCEGDQQCVDGGKLGACEPSGFCSFPDPKCPGGKRYGEYAGDELAGACVEGEGATGGGCEEDCGPCGTCVAGSCAPKSAGEACEVACEQYVFGAGEGGACLAYASAAGSGTCDGAGACTPAEGACTTPGAEIAGCDVACARADHNCTPGTPVEAVTVASLCVTGGSTDACKGACVDVMGAHSELQPRACDGEGNCADGPPQDCGGYTCAASLDACGTSCTKQNECVAGFMCTANACE